MAHSSFINPRTKKKIKGQWQAAKIQYKLVATVGEEMKW